MKALRKTDCYFAVGMVILFLSIAATAQTPVYHPGDTIQLAVTFEGVDAGKVTGASMNWFTQTIPDNQPGFQQSMFGNQSQQTGPNTFRISFKVPDTQARGEYTLNQLRAELKVGSNSVTALYQQSDFPARTIRVENSTTITKPKIKDVTVP